MHNFLFVVFWLFCLSTVNSLLNSRRFFSFLACFFLFVDFQGRVSQLSPTYLLLNLLTNNKMERHVTDCEGLRIVVSMTDEVSDAITDWARVAELYERKTESTLQILGQYFITKNQFVIFHPEIKFHILKGLTEDDKKTFDDSSMYLNKKLKSGLMK